MVLGVKSDLCHLAGYILNTQRLMIELKSATFIVVHPSKVFQDFASCFSPHFIVNIVSGDLNQPWPLINSPLLTMESCPEIVKLAIVSQRVLSIARICVIVLYNKS